MITKVYRSIFRVDYPLSYSIIDRLGEQAEFLMKSASDKSKWKDIHCNVNIAENSLVFSGTIHDSFFRLVCTPKTVNGVIYHFEGEDVRRVHSHPVFELGQSALAKLELGNSFSKLDRIGIRLIFISTSNKLSYDNLLNYFIEKNMTVSSVITSKFAKPADIGFIFDSKNEDDIFMKLQMGPYQKSESGRYFEKTKDKEVEISEGLISDIDIWESNINFAGLNLCNIAQSHSKVFNELTDELGRKILGEVK